MNFQVPGRMGMLTVLFLIITSIHANVDGPSGRGFSYIEMWYVGMFIPILVAIFEYAIILVIIKFKPVDGHIQISCLKSKVKVDQFLAYIDIMFLFVNLAFLIVFVIWFYYTVLSAVGYKN